MNETYVAGVVIDVCTRSFLLLSDEGEEKMVECETAEQFMSCLLYTSPSPRDRTRSRMPSSA